MEGTRVAPLRQFMSIPKLELQAAVLCVRLLNVIKTEHTYEISSYYLWTDSTTILQWIRSHSRRNPTLIANRIAEIQDDSDPSEWRHVPGRLNVADDGSRCLRLANLDPECRWLIGPAFLTLPEEFWPADIAVPQEVSLATEVTSSSCVSDVSKDSPLNPTQFSSWHVTPNLLDLAIHE
jgi:hypothetical protein